MVPLQIGATGTKASARSAPLSAHVSKVAAATFPVTVEFVDSATCDCAVQVKDAGPAARNLTRCRENPASGVPSWLAVARSDGGQGWRSMVDS
jgi:hypothetical protein